MIAMTASGGVSKHAFGADTASVVAPAAGQRFLQGDVLQPPLWKAEEAAANLIKVTNQLFNRSYIE
jgi:hypothetical protein